MVDQGRRGAGGRFRGSGHGISDGLAVHRPLHHAFYQAKCSLSVWSRRIRLKKLKTKSVPNNVPDCVKTYGGVGCAISGDFSPSRPPIRAVFQSYFRVVIIVRGAGIMRRALGGG
jgi:hypothetical protein